MAQFNGGRSGLTTEGEGRSTTEDTEDTEGENEINMIFFIPSASSASSVVSPDLPPLNWAIFGLGG